MRDDVLRDVLDAGDAVVREFESLDSPIVAALADSLMELRWGAGLPLDVGKRLESQPPPERGAND